MASLAEALIRTFLPACCSLCRQPLPWRGSEAGVCTRCWQDVREHTPRCPVCGDPESAGGGPCLACATDPPAWRAAAAAGPYEGTLRDLILLFKQGRRDELARPLAALLLRAYRRAEWPRPTAVVPVPMWWGRRLRRGFNQAELLAGELSAALGARTVAALSRRRGRPQAGQGRSGRRRLSRSALVRRRPVTGPVLLIDDVLTTGATASACARALRDAGADDVYVLTLARTSPPGRIP
jgi:ComF family protein